MDNLAHSEIFALTLVIGTYLTSLALYKKVHISLLHPLLTTIFVIIVVLEVLGIQYESFQQSSHLIHFMLGPSVVALGYVLYEQIQYLKGNVVSILTSVFVGIQKSQNNDTGVFVFDKAELIVVDTIPVIYPVISLVFGLTGQNTHYITQFQ